MEPRSEVSLDRRERGLGPPSVRTRGRCVTAPIGAPTSAPIGRRTSETPKVTGASMRAGYPTAVIPMAAPCWAPAVRPEGGVVSEIGGANRPVAAPRVPRRARTAGLGGGDVEATPTGTGGFGAQPNCPASTIATVAMATA
jgi:hypothetical protein